MSQVHSGNILEVNITWSVLTPEKNNVLPLIDNTMVQIMGRIILPEN